MGNRAKSNLAKLTSDWLSENDPSRKRRQRGPRDDNCRFLRDKKIKKFRPPSIRDFVEANRHVKTAECVFVPGSAEGKPAAINRFGRNISAARYMALLTFGTPKSEGMVVRHLCGNGHLSCVNPAHLAWGSPGDNQSDANKHRALGDDATEHDKVNAVTPNA